MEELALVQQVLREAEVPPPYSKVFVIGQGATQVTVYSQQVRALQLIWALNKRLSLLGAEVVVVGGGVSGVTAAAAAMLFGGKVTLLEHGEELLHLQRGCHSRYLHPRVFEWPERTALHAAAGLPILNWSVGSASDVANQILADYHRIRLIREPAEPLREHCVARDVRISDDGDSISWRHAQKAHVSHPRVIVLALGFGIERNTGQLAPRSYWRVDSLTQTPLDRDDDAYRVLVSGTGDGGIIDVLRAKLKEFDHGGFLDECVLRLGGDELRKAIKEVDAEAAERLTRHPAAHDDPVAAERSISAWLHEQYCELEGLSAIDDLLGVARPGTELTWVGRMPYPLSPASQPLNRILGWRLWSLGLVRYRQGLVTDVRWVAAPGAERPLYSVVLEPASGSSTDPLLVHQVVIRHGSVSSLERSFPDVHAKLKEVGRRASRVTELPWEIGRTYKEKAKELRVRVSACELSRRVKILARPEPARMHEGKPHYRIRVWLEGEGALGHVAWVDYDHHPEYGSVVRRAMYLKHPAEGQHFRHWINTRDDFWIRVRCSDGSEFGDWVSRAVERGGGGDPALVKQCVADLRQEATRMRDPSYMGRVWSDAVDVERGEPFSRSDTDSRAARRASCQPGVFRSAL